MNTHVDRVAITQFADGNRRAARFAARLLLAAIVASTLPARTRADNFAEVHYSARKDQLVVTVAYRGTHPDHVFSLKWGACREVGGGGHEIAGEVLDSQWQDVEQRDFQKTNRFSLADIPCRPAKATLRLAPRFFATVQIPATVVQKP